MPRAAAKTKRSGVTSAQNAYYTIQEVMTILGCGRTKAQDVVRELNDELEAKGYMRFPQGKVPKKYLHEKFYLQEMKK